MNPTYADMVFDRIEELGPDNKSVRVFQAREKTTELIDATMQTCLELLGVDYSKEDGSGAYIQPQMMDRDIVVTELDAEGLMTLAKLTNQEPDPGTLGFYIYQDLVPKFFIQDPKVDSEGRVIIRVYSFDQNIQFTRGDFRIPV